MCWLSFRSPQHQAANSGGRYTRFSDTGDEDDDVQLVQSFIQLQADTQGSEADQPPQDAIPSQDIRGNEADKPPQDSIPLQDNRGNEVDEPPQDFPLKDIHSRVLVEQYQTHSIETAEINSGVDRPEIEPCVFSRVETEFDSRPDSPEVKPHSEHPIVGEKDAPSPFSGPVVDSYNTQSYLPTWFTPVASLLECTHHGRTYWDDTNDFGLEIPAGAIPEGVTLSIDIGVALYGPFQFPQGLRPASPVFWICVRQLEFSEFEKPITVTLPHFFSLNQDKDAESLGLTFLKARHERNQDQLYEFQPLTDGVVCFNPCKKSGVLQTTHFCSLCVSCKDAMEVIRMASFCVSAVVPKTVAIDESSYADFYITFLLKTCLSKLNDKLQDSAHSVERECQEFQFEREDRALELFLPESVPNKWSFGYRFTKMVKYYKQTFWHHKYLFYFTDFCG